MSSMAIPVAIPAARPANTKLPNTLESSHDQLLGFNSSVQDGQESESQTDHSVSSAAFNKSPATGRVEKPKRVRRKFKDIDRSVQCDVPGCERFYTNNSCMRTHKKRKHSGVPETPRKKKTVVNRQRAIGIRSSTPKGLPATMSSPLVNRARIGAGISARMAGNQQTGNAGHGNVLMGERVRSTQSDTQDVNFDIASPSFEHFVRHLNLQNESLEMQSPYQTLAYPRNMLPANLQHPSLFTQNSGGYINGFSPSPMMSPGSHQLNTDFSNMMSSFSSMHSMPMQPIQFPGLVHPASQDVASGRQSSVSIQSQGLLAPQPADQNLKGLEGVPTLDNPIDADIAELDCVSRYASTVESPLNLNHMSFLQPHLAQTNLHDPLWLNQYTQQPGAQNVGQMQDQNAMPAKMGDAESINWLYTQLDQHTPLSAGQP